MNLNRAELLPHAKIIAVLNRHLLGDDVAVLVSVA